MTIRIDKRTVNTFGKKSRIFIVSDPDRGCPLCGAAPHGSAPDLEGAMRMMEELIRRQHETWRSRVDPGKGK